MILFTSWNNLSRSHVIPYGLFWLVLLLHSIDLEISVAALYRSGPLVLYCSFLWIFDKVLSYEMPCKLLNLVIAFLKKKKQISSPYVSGYEVPELLTQRFLLNLIKINDFSENLSSYVKEFVDDTSFLSIVYDKILPRKS